MTGTFARFWTTTVRPVCWVWCGSHPSSGSPRAWLWPSWSGTIFGMVFALNFPMMTAWFNKVESLPPVSEWSAKLLVLAGLVGATAVWATTVLPLPKLQYNRVHPYFVVVPIITWIYIRNISATLRKYHLHGLVRVSSCVVMTVWLWLCGCGCVGVWWLTKRGHCRRPLARSRWRHTCCSTTFSSPATPSRCSPCSPDTPSATSLSYVGSRVGGSDSQRTQHVWN